MTHSPMLGYCRASVADDGPTLTQHWVNVSRLLCHVFIKWLTIPIIPLYLGVGGLIEYLVISRRPATKRSFTGRTLKPSKRGDTL